MHEFFQFEADFVDSLRCIPMLVRYKLDTCGIKLKLHQWNHFSEADRLQLVQMPCQSTTEIESYRAYLQQLVQTRTGEVAKDLPIEANPDWADTSQIPVLVTEKAHEQGVQLSLHHWAGLTTLQRFALIKLSRSSHENHNFLPALQEFQLV